MSAHADNANVSAANTAHAKHLFARPHSPKNICAAPKPFEPFYGRQMTVR
jgi:hypothetical protein